MYKIDSKLSLWGCLVPRSEASQTFWERCFLFEGETLEKIGLKL
jgi:hypothetical protein